MLVVPSEKLPIKIWTSENDYPDYEVLEQFKNLANHPLAFKYVCGMPDYHLGYGMPIGGVLATVGGVIPNAVGVDIGCGMIAVRTEMQSDDLSREDLQKLRQAIHARVPVGQKSHAESQPMPDLRDSIWNEIGFDSHYLVNRKAEKAFFQMGTLGGGNHFIEIQRAEEDGRVWIMIHSGSRGIGAQVCRQYHGMALDLMEKYRSAVPHKDLAFLPQGTQAYEDYLTEMRWCMRFAELNREAMFAAVTDAFGEVFDMELDPRPETFDTFVDTHHNFAQMEHHFGKNVLVHRKGAVKAEGLVTIPGSMGTASYIGEGLKPVESFNTCSHGAGRVLSRRAAKAAIKHEEAIEAMQHVVFGVREGDYDEFPHAYKDLEAVMEAQSALVKPLVKLLPLAVVKG